MVRCAICSCNWVDYRDCDQIKDLFLQNSFYVLMGYVG